MRWYLFKDTFSAGYEKTIYDFISIQAVDQEEACMWFNKLTGLSVYDESCDCCTPDWCCVSSTPECLSSHYESCFSIERSVLVETFGEPTID